MICPCCSTKFFPTHRHPDFCSPRCESLYELEKDHPGIYKIANSQNRWQAVISVKGEAIQLGGWDSWEKALIARLAGEKKYKPAIKPKVNTTIGTDGIIQGLLCKQWSKRI